MGTVVTQAEARERRFHHRLFNGTDTWLSTYVGLNVAERRASGRTSDPAPAAYGELYPVAYLVEQAPRTLIHGHFHKADQFQVFVSGGASFGKKLIAGIHIHYAGAFTAYAPITAGDDMLEYFTLRNGWDAGAQWMPQSRGELSKEGHLRRHALGAVGNGVSETVIPPEPDGLGAWSYRLNLGATARGVPPSSGRGQYWLVLRGSCTLEQRDLAERTLVFVAPADGPVEITSTAPDTHVVAVQFPKKP